MNKPIEWKDSYGVGVKIIDKQHKKLFSWINQLYLAAKENKTEPIQEALKGLQEYINFHFGVEEKYFDEFEYFNKAEHKMEHKIYADKMTSFVKQYKADGAVPADALDFLESWIIGHVLGSDKKYVKCFHDHGLE